MHIGNMQYVGTQNRGMRKTFAETSLKFIKELGSNSEAEAEDISICSLKPDYVNLLLALLQALLKVSIFL